MAPQSCEFGLLRAYEPDSLGRAPRSVLFPASQMPTQFTIHARQRTRRPDADRAKAVPPALPPSIEEAYRRKCVQLKTRTNEVEDANDAARLRLARIKRQIEKLRIERAFLLEQLAKRTSTNVEDSEGSPSPPPTVRSTPPLSRAAPRLLCLPAAGQLPLPPLHPPYKSQSNGNKPADYRNGSDANPRKPKDKPLRIKRGHRKSAANDGEPKAGASKDAASPASESQSQRPENQAEGGKAAPTSYASKFPKTDRNAFEFYCRKTRPGLESNNKGECANVDEELARGWEELPEGTKDAFWRKSEDPMEKRRQEKVFKETKDSGKDKDCKSPAGSTKADPHDDDVEMAQFDSGDDEQLAQDEME